MLSEHVVSFIRQIEVCQFVMLHDFQDLTKVIYDRSEQYVKVVLLTYVRCK